MNIILIGQPGTKRRDYFLKAAQELGAGVSFYEIGSSLVHVAKNSIVKIDPPQYEDCDLSNLNILVKGYTSYLEDIGSNKKLTFLNSPESIIDTLNKRKCKDILVKNRISVTPLVNEIFPDIDALRRYIRENKTYSLFIKPCFGSGAAGIIAYRYHPKICSEFIYTSINKIDGKFVNTKKTLRIDQIERVEELVNFIFSQPYIIEKWIPKPKYKNFNYDIRVVYQFGKIDFMVARCSGSPITNLHLNNNALDINLLKLPQSVICKIGYVCREAVACFNGLNYAGIDILLRGKNLEPVIIEMNAQGDLIHQDIYNENRIYKNQLIRMVNYG
ncbi:MAG: hypothetical protein GX270_08635 [Clostridiaceae bacterium]|nr:hypothetical protein [Clostridiaceae bacterium]